MAGNFRRLLTFVESQRKPSELIFTHGFKFCDSNTVQGRGTAQSIMKSIHTLELTRSFPYHEAASAETWINSMG